MLDGTFSFYAEHLLLIVAIEDCSEKGDEVAHVEEPAYLIGEPPAVL